MSTLSVQVQAMVDQLRPKPREMTEEEVKRLCEIVTEKKGRFFGVYNAGYWFDEESLYFSYDYSMQNENTHWGIILRPPYNLCWVVEEIDISGVIFKPDIIANHRTEKEGTVMLHILSQHATHIFDQDLQTFDQAVVEVPGTDGESVLMTLDEANAFLANVIMSVGN